MRIGEWSASAAAKLGQANIGSANLDALIMLEDELGKDRAWLLAHPEFEIAAHRLKSLNAKLKRRLAHEPMAYIRGFSEFYGRKFLIDKRVLEPRPESEAMIEMLLGQKLEPNVVITDIGTGSGAIAITTKLQLPTAIVLATEIDAKALKVAHQNAKDRKADIELLEGNLLEPIKQPIDVILANLPYVPDKWQINEAAAMEPRAAIFGGEDGLDLYRQMFKQIEGLKLKPHLIFTESLPFQHASLADIARASGYRQVGGRDFIQLFTNR